MQGKLDEASRITPTPPPPPAVDPIVSQGQAFFANRTDLPTAESAKEEVSEKSKPKKAAPAKKAKKAPAKKAAPAKKTAPAKKEAKKATTSASADDWSGLSTSTLMRKRIQQLIDYLEAKGIATKNADGEDLKKSELVEAVQSSK